MVEPPFASSAARGRVPVRIVSVRAVTDSHPAAVAVKPENLRLCTADELARLHVEPLVKHVQNELHAASVALQAAGDDVPKIDAALTRLRACVEHAEAALAYVEGPDNALTEDVTGTARVRLAATYAFFSATACATVASACQGRGDLAGQLAAYARAFNKALQHPMVHAVAKSFRHTGLVVNTLLSYGEALRLAGRRREAVPPLRAGIRIALSEGDTASEADAQGTLSTVFLGLSQFEEADVAGEREVALLLAMRSQSHVKPRKASLALALARAQVGLGSVKHSRAKSMPPCPDAFAFEARAEALADAALSAVPRNPSVEVAEWAEVESGVHSLRGHFARFRNDLEAAARHHELSLEVANRGLRDAAGSGALSTVLPTDAGVAPHFQLEHIYVEMAARARESGAMDEALNHAQKAVHHRRELFRVLRKPMPAECSICAEALEAEEASSDVKVLPCMHAFHARCVDPWLLDKMKGTCPLCREWSVSANREDVDACRVMMEAFGNA